MVTVRHSIEGRSRFRCLELKKRPYLAHVVERKLQTLEGVVHVRCNTKCAAVVVDFSSELLHNTDIIQEIASCCLLHDDQLYTIAKSCSEKEICDCETSISARGLEFGALTAVMGGIFLRSRLTTLALSQTLFSPLGLIAAAFSLPLLYQGLQSLKKKRRMTLEAFLGAGVLTALGAGEALTALEILWVNSGSELLSSYVADKSRKAVRSILEVTEKSVFVMRNDIELEVAIEDIRKNDIVTVHTGEKISIDGELVRGEGMVNEAPINGRNELVHKVENDHVYAGTYVQQGVIYVRAEHVGDETYLSRILYMVEDSLANKASIELAADRLAHRLIHIGFFMTLLTFMLTGSWFNALSVLLVMSCPCATILSASSAVSAALSNAASKGILIKGGRYLEEAGAMSSFCFDKTGTLTADHPVITDIVPRDGYSDETVLHTAHVAELHNRHPLAIAVRDKADEFCLEHPHHTVCESILGMGVRAESDGSEYLIGNSKLMKKHSVDIADMLAQKKKLQRKGKTVMSVAKDGELVGLLCVENKIKEGAESVIHELRADGIKEMILVTGDEEPSAKALAKKLTFDTYYCSVLPDEKEKIVREIQKEHKVAMVGDGINDVLALAAADLSIAMGAMGSDIAIETADIALVDDDLNKILYLRRLSHRTLSIVNQNFTVATGSNIVGAFLGMAGILNPLMAGMIHIVHTVGIMLNSSRLLRDIKTDQKEEEQDD